MSKLVHVDGELIDPTLIDGWIDTITPKRISKIKKPWQSLMYEPQPKQARLMQAAGVLDWYYARGSIVAPVAPIIGYGGAAYGGKSYGLLGLAKALAYAFPGVQIAFFRRTYAEMSGPGTVLTKDAPELFLDVASRRDEGRHYHFDDVGSDFYFRHCEHESDVYKYHGAQIDVLMFDEVTSFTWMMIDYLLTRNRVSGANGIIKPFCVMATNPGQIGHQWYMDLFKLGDNMTMWLEMEERGEMEPVEIINPSDQKSSVYFIPAFIADNEIGLERDPEYESRLRERNPALAEALIEGNWLIFHGKAFMEFDPRIHVIEPREIPKHLPKWRAVDWGIAAPFCCLWAALDIDSGQIIVYREVYAAGLTDAQQARLIVTYSPDVEGVTLTYGDPKSFRVRKSSGMIFYTAADEYAKEGVIILDADNDRIAGKRKVHSALALMQNGQPGLVISKNCPNLIKQLSTLATNPENPEDVDYNQEDHAYDTLRYLMTNPTLKHKRKKKKKEQPNPWEGVKNI